MFLVHKTRSMSDKVEFVAPEDLEKYVKENSAPFMSDANIKAALKKLKLPESLPFEERMRIDSEDPEDVVVKDVEDDKERELALYFFFLFRFYYIFPPFLSFSFFFLLVISLR